MEDISETELLQRIFPLLDTSGSALLGPGDDAAVIAAPDGRTVVTIDTQVQDQDFRLRWANGYETTGFDVGWKAGAQNLSDINAMGAEATAMVVSLTMPGKTPVGWVEGMARGLDTAIRELGGGACSVAGGDLSRGSEIVVTVTVLGHLAGRAPVLRSGAMPGDVVALAGTAGRAAAGFALLESGHGMDTLDEDQLALVKNQCRPLPPLWAGPAAAEAGASSMIDLSDGLVRDSGRVATASGVVVDLDLAAVDRLAAPLQSTAELLGANARDWALGGGEDHGLLVTFRADKELSEGFTRIGSIYAGEAGVTMNGDPLTITGWDHFAH
ncbi:thiamine-phosphate kinase [Arthrobacter castelli]|uniref:thiamine-phosphate kinase n=1 Tax=Arthrobacter castelli TaxID=271431 RepID=UPI0004094387|nr:thiamine-phosphate kinase [Arthrobacter castelli]